MIRYQTMTSRVSDILKNVIPLDEEFEIVEYDPYEHHLVVPQIYARTLEKRPLGEKWDAVEGFYREGIYLAYHKEDGFYIGFAMSKLCENTPYISAIGVMKDFRNRGIGTYLVQKIAQHYAKMGYSDMWIDIKPHFGNVITHWAKLGFRKIEDDMR